MSLIIRVLFFQMASFSSYENTMLENMFKDRDISISYNSILNRFSLAKNDEWISISITTFYVWMGMLDVETDYEHVIIDQNPSTVEITKIFSSINLKFKSKNYISCISLKEETVRKIHCQSENMKRHIKLRRRIMVNESETKSIKRVTPTRSFNEGNKKYVKTRKMNNVNRVNQSNNEMNTSEMMKKKITNKWGENISDDILSNETDGKYIKYKVLSY